MEKINEIVKELAKYVLINLLLTEQRDISAWNMKITNEAFNFPYHHIFRGFRRKLVATITKRR